MLGFLWGYPIDTPIETVFHIAYISVEERSRGRGIGRQLLEEAEKICKQLGLNHVELIVGKKNYDAIRFYNNCEYNVNQYMLRKLVI